MVDVKMPVSILIPAFQEAHNIARALDSCLGQTLEPEIVVGVEAEDQETLEIVKTYSRAHQNIIPDIYDSRRSVCAKINSMLKKCNHDIVVKMDADMIWGNSEALQNARSYFSDPAVGGIMMQGDRGLSGYGEIFDLVRDSAIRDLVKQERTKSLSARGENVLCRLVDKYRLSLLPLRHRPQYPIDIHCFRRDLVSELDESLIHDDAQLAFQVLDKKHAIVNAGNVVLLHLGVPATFTKLFRQKMKGNTGWHAFNKKYHIRMQRYNLELLRFILRNITRLSATDAMALLCWLVTYALTKIMFPLQRSFTSQELHWASPRES